MFNLCINALLLFELAVFVLKWPNTFVLMWIENVDVYDEIEPSKPFRWSVCHWRR